MDLKNIHMDEGDGGVSDNGTGEVILMGNERVERTPIKQITANHVELDKSPCMYIQADSVELSDSPTWCVCGKNVTARDSRAVVIFADNMDGNYETIFTAKTAAILGITCGLAFALFSRIFRSK